MYFIEIDDKNECVGFFSDGKLTFSQPVYEQYTRTWKYSPPMRDHNHIEYAYLYTGQKDLDIFCPIHLRERWSHLNKKMHAFMKSFITSKVNLEQSCIFDLLPEKFMTDFLNTKLEITKNIFQTVSKPINYDHLLDTTKMLEDIKSQEVKVNLFLAKEESYKTKVRTFYNNIRNMRNSVSYNLFGTKTGRLTTEKGSFPILTLDKDLRKYIEPNNDLFVELDYNAAELRTLLALLGKPQPREDIHEWNIKNLLEGNITREEAKKRVFSWLYNPTSEDSVLNQVYNREAIKEKYWNGTTITTPFQREVESDEYHSINYILQSTTSDLFLEQAVKVNQILETRRSFVAFLLHDSIILDFKQEEKREILNIIKKFQDTRLGKYKVNVKMGKNFGDMKAVKWTQ